MTKDEEKMVKMMICAFEDRPANSLDSVAFKTIDIDLLNCRENIFVEWHVVEFTGDMNSIMTCANFKELFPNRENILIYNFLFNRTKAYYSGLKFSDKAWYHQPPVCYQSIDLSASQSEYKSKIFVNPAKIYVDKTDVKRPLISAFLSRYNGHQSRFYVGPAHMLPADKPLYLMGQNGNIDWPENYEPVHNKYYEDTFISIYAESIEKSPMVYITEKTYDPLIKGHFILPFAAKGIIKYLKLEKFKFPDFIDYSYDSIVDDDERYEVYIKEVERLVNLPLDVWQSHWDNNLHILIYNQSVFYNSDYYQIIDQINNLKQ